MTIDWPHFTPWASLTGGALIGLAAALLAVFNGRIAGISGILGGLLTRTRGEFGWRIAFLIGLIAAPLAYILFAPPATSPGQRQPHHPHHRGPAGWPGHALRRRLHQRPWRVRSGAAIPAFAGGHAGLHGQRLRHGLHPAPPARMKRATHLILALLAGLTFGIGLIVSGMTNPAKVMGFLDLAGRWDPSLAFVMVGAIALAWAGFRLIGQRGATLLGEPLHLPHHPPHRPPPDAGRPHLRHRLGSGRLLPRSCARLACQRRRQRTDILRRNACRNDPVRGHRPSARPLALASGSCATALAAVAHLFHNVDPLTPVQSLRRKAHDDHSPEEATKSNDRNYRRHERHRADHGADGGAARRQSGTGRAQRDGT